MKWFAIYAFITFWLSLAILLCIPPKDDKENIIGLILASMLGFVLWMPLAWFLIKYLHYKLYISKERS